MMDAMITSAGIVVLKVCKGPYFCFIAVFFNWSIGVLLISQLSSMQRCFVLILESTINLFYVFAQKELNKKIKLSCIHTSRALQHGKQAF